MNIWKIAIDFLAFNQDNTDGVFPKTTVKSLFEDDRGDIWIGTWSQGLFRYEKRTGKYRKYPQMNSGNSAHVVFQDSHKNIWVGTWGAGLHLLHDAYNPEKTTWTTFTHDENRSGTISDNLIYAISEDLNTNSLWVGTRSGLSILSLMDIKTGHLEFENVIRENRRILLPVAKWLLYCVTGRVLCGWV